MAGMLFAALFATAQVEAADPPLKVAAHELQSAAGEHRLVLLGEMHGTREIPDLVEHLVSAYAEQGPVLLGLEIPGSEQRTLHRYLDSDGGGDARDALLATRFWNIRGDQHDGRRSYDMLDLVEHVRRLRQQGRDVSLLAYDSEPGPRSSPDARDRAMAARVRTAFNALPSGRMLVLTGNVHAMLERPEDAPAEIPLAMGYWLRDSGPWAVDIKAERGHFWACRNGCGALPMRYGPASGPLADEPWHYRLVLPEFSVARLIGIDRSR